MRADAHRWREELVVEIMREATLPHFADVDSLTPVSSDTFLFITQPIPTCSRKRRDHGEADALVDTTACRHLADAVRA